MPEMVIVSWDYRDQIDRAELHRAVYDISGGRVHITEIATDSDQYAVIVSDEPVDDETALAAYEEWETSR